MKDMERMDRQFAFLREADKEKTIERQTYISDASRKENDAEHAWHAALMAIITSEYANEKIDVLKVVTMLLIHDIVEIDAGDTYAYDEEAKKTQEAREKAAAERLFGLLPKDQGEKFKALFEEFEEVKTPEARFARAMDHIQPVILNDAAGGISWKEHDVELAQILARNKDTHTGSEELWKYALERLLKPNVEKGNIRP